VMTILLVRDNAARVARGAAQGLWIAENG
jgi:hypothetical protein